MSEYDKEFWGEPPVLTNYDRIRAMSAEEMAAVLGKASSLDGADFCQNLTECDAILEAGQEIPDEKCISCIIRWLNSPAEGSAE